MGFGLGGLALALGFTLAASAFTNDDLGSPINPVATTSSSGASDVPSETASPGPERTPSDRPSVSASPSDDHGGHGDDDSGSGSDDNSGSGSDNSGSGSSGSGEDHGSDDD